jgi:hypothetical protein
VRRHRVVTDRKAAIAAGTDRAIEGTVTTRVARTERPSSRGTFYECIFSPDGNEYRFHVRAVDPLDAEAHIRTSLRDNGVREAGTLLIRDRKGAELVRSGYAFEGFGPA